MTRRIPPLNEPRVVIEFTGEYVTRELVPMRLVCKRRRVSFVLKPAEGEQFLRMEKPPCSTDARS